MVIISMKILKFGRTITDLCNYYVVSSLFCRFGSQIITEP